MKKNVRTPQQITAKIRHYSAYSTIVYGLFGLEVLAFLAYAFCIFSGIFPRSQTLYGNATITLISFLTLLLMILFYFSSSEVSTLSKYGKMSLLLAITFFFLGDLLWSFHEIFLNNPVPVGSLADVFWNLAYISLLISLYHFVFSYFRESNFWPNVFIFFGVIGAAITLFQARLNFLSLGYFDFSLFIQDLYPAYDFLALGLLLALIVPALLFNASILIGFYSWTFGILTRIVYDLVFSYMIKEGTFYTGHPLDLLYLVFYLAISFSCVFYLMFRCTPHKRK